MKIEGMAWITPLGNGLDEVRSRIQKNERGEIKEIATPKTGKTENVGKPHQYMAVPANAAAAVSRQPRLRRSSVISHLTAATALAALENAGIEMTPEIAERTAVVFGVVSGGVIYTRKFYEQIVEQGANAASPLFFPETVYNAPASHLAALLGLSGFSATLVGDASVGIAALKHAEQLLQTADIDRCIVVGGEEIDWVLCEAYREWRLPVTLAEGAAALVVSRDESANKKENDGADEIAISEIHDGVSFFSRREADAALRRVLGDLSKNGATDCVIASANGTFIDRVESLAVSEIFPSAKTIAPKQNLGEALGASALMQVILGALEIQNENVKNAKKPQRVVISTLGLNQQASGLTLVRG